MFILGIDTATRVCSVALCRDAEVLAESTADAGVTHSQRLLPSLERLLQQAGVAKEEIDLVGVSMGPGSFTGLRIGLATAEAFAYARRICLHGVDTLAALAWNCRQEGVLLAPVLDAQKGNYYRALYEWCDGRLECVSPTVILSRTGLWQDLQERKCLVLGECDKLTELPAYVKLAEPGQRMPRATGVCGLALRDFDPVLDQKIFGLEPYYLRKSEAEELWEQRHP